LREKEGTMDNPFSTFWQEIVARPEGPLAFRFYLQPLMAAGLAIRDGLKDAQLGKPAYFWAVFTDRSNRRAFMRDGWQAIKRVFVLAIAIDLIYQLIVLKGVRPLETLVIAVMLAIVPYLLVRGPANRIARRIRRGGPGAAAPGGHRPQPSGR
jgi:hypothetical protein